MTKALLILLSLLLAALALAQDAPKIKAGDMLRLTCEEEATLNKEYAVSRQGMILVDFLGAFKVEGMTESEAADAISKKLVDEWSWGQAQPPEEPHPNYRNVLQPRSQCCLRCCFLRPRY